MTINIGEKMKNYKVSIPESYEVIRTIGYQISQTILARRVPQPDHIALVLGEDAKKAYYFMHALLHNIEEGRKRGILDYARRDQKAIQRHSFDAAQKPYFRLKDKKLPSNYILTPREIKGVLGHDLGEEFGQSLLGAMIVNDIIGYLLGEETGRDTSLLTNTNALLMDSLEDRISDKVAKTKARDIEPDHVYSVLKEAKSEVHVKPGTVSYNYLRILNALRTFRAYVEDTANYMPESQRKAILNMSDELSEGVRRRMRNGGVKADDATEQNTSKHEHVMEILERGEYTEADGRLVPPGSPKFLATLKKTLYRDFISEIAQKVRQDSQSSSRNGSNDYLAPMRVKFAESTETAANMDSTLINAISIFRKGRILDAFGIELGGYLRTQGRDYLSLQMPLVYHFKNLDASVDQNYEEFRRKFERDTAWEPEFKAFGVMKEKMDDLERRITAMESPSWVRERIRDIGNMFGITELKLGKVHFTL